MGFFDFLLKKTEFITYSEAKNEGLRAIAVRFRGSNEDTVFVTTSRYCPTCSMYNRRIFSLWGRYKTFPVLPAFLHNATCPTCGIHIGYSHYFPGLNGDLQKDIAYSNRPFIDSRTAAEINVWDERVKEHEFNEKLERDYDWICKNLPDFKPKNIGGYKRMAKSNSANYQKLVSLAMAKGYLI